MTTKEKILAALGCSLEDLTEERLLDVLLDAYAAKKRRIVELEAENADERERLQQEEDAARLERHRVRNDPLYGMEGDYYFKLVLVPPDRAMIDRFRVTIAGGRVDLLQYTKGGYCVVACRMTPQEWESVK